MGDGNPVTIATLSTCSHEWLHEGDRRCSNHIMFQKSQPLGTGCSLTTACTITSEHVGEADQGALEQIRTARTAWTAGLSMDLLIRRTRMP